MSRKSPLKLYYVADVDDELRMHALDIIEDPQYKLGDRFDDLKWVTFFDELEHRANVMFVDDQNATCEVVGVTTVCPAVATIIEHVRCYLVGDVRRHLRTHACDHK